MNIDPVLRVLDEIEAPYALVGAHAVAVRGYVRFTLDIDLLTSSRDVLEESPWRDLMAAGATISRRRADEEDPLGGVVRILLPDSTDVDIIVARWQWEAEVIRRAETMSIGSTRLPVPLASDLILLKLAAGGMLDLRDAAALLAVGDRPALIQEVESRIVDVRPDVTDTWRQVLAIEQ